MKRKRAGKVDKLCVWWGLVEAVILSSVGRAGPTEKMTLGPVSETRRLKLVAGAHGARKFFRHHQERLSSLKHPDF